MRAGIHYIIAVILLIIYGGQVCPFLESLSINTLAAVIALWLLLAFISRMKFVKTTIENAEAQTRAVRQFFLETGIFCSAGLAMTFFNMIVFGFPISSGLKLFVGCSTLGFFAAADLALARDYKVAEELNKKGDALDLLPRFFSLTRKFTIFATILSVVTSIVLILVIIHDLDWIRQLPANTNLSSASIGIIKEISFILIVLLSFTTNLIFSYTRNLKFYFGRQTSVLEEVAGGKLDGHVPITTSDEFGVIAHYTNQMISGLRERTRQLQQTQDVTILTLASLAETRDNETGQHIIRTQNYVLILAQNLKYHPKFRNYLDETSIDLLFKSAPLHDIGKVGIQDNILLKPGSLTREEFEEMKKHTFYGSDALLAAEARLGKNSFLHFAREIACSHHEKWDGSGYPEGLKGEDIPVSGRLMALGDVYDALISKRVYKKAFSHEKAYSIIIEGKGTHFDPDVVDAFIKCEEDFKHIADRNRDRT
ncbi:MAG: HD domain-containing protein [Desulfobacteraceae bacterium]|nr:HD domain-containing protein [Desulfobacteraceae bacterium]